jgi:hypothetical protein
MAGVKRRRASSGRFNLKVAPEPVVHRRLLVALLLPLTIVSSIPCSVCACRDQAISGSGNPGGWEQGCCCCCGGHQLAAMCAWFGVFPQSVHSRSCCELDEEASGDSSGQPTERRCCRRFLIPEPRLLQADSLAVDSFWDSEAVFSLNRDEFSFVISSLSGHSIGPPLRPHAAAAALTSQVLQI